MANSSGLNERPSRTSLRGVTSLYQGSMSGMLLLWKPLRRWPSCRESHTECHSQFREGLDHVAEGTTNAVSRRHVESRCQGGLVERLRVAPLNSQSLLQLPLGISGGFGIGVRHGIVPDPACAA